MADKPPLVRTKYECPRECGFIGNRAAFILERGRQHGADTYRCPECDKQVRI